MTTETEPAKREFPVGIKGSGRSYEQYHKLGGIINKDAYQSAMDRASQQATLPDKTLVGQAKHISQVAGIHLSKDELFEVISLYGVLRNDTDPGAEYHHGQMSDERLIAEALRMLNYPGQLGKVIETYHHHSMF